MRITFLFIFLSNLYLTAQNKTGAFSSFDLYYGYRPQFQNFYNQLNTVKDLNFGKPLQMVGIGLSGQFVVMRDGTFNGHFIYNQIIPQTIYVSDTLEAKVSGFVFSFAYGGAITTKSEKFALCYYLGFNTGRLRMYSNDVLKQKNPFFSPKIGIQPKAKIGKISLTLILDYEYDATNPNWRRTIFSNPNQSTLASLRQTGITGQLGIGYVMD
jgi:hypothetical protein